MNSIGLIRHEIRRLILSKKFFYMILVLSIFTLDIVLRLMTGGRYGTAPFSQWSYSSFITMISPQLMIILILLCTNVFSEKEMRVRKIIFSTPISQIKYYLIKTVSISVACIIAALIPIVMSFIYYGVMFEFYDYFTFSKPILFFLVPSSIFILGLSMFIGKKSLKLLYVLLPFVFLNSLNFRFPVWIDLYGNNFLLEYGYRHILWRNNTAGIVPYNLPTDFIISRAVFVCFGIILFISACKKSDVV